MSIPSPSALQAEALPAPAPPTPLPERGIILRRAPHDRLVCADLTREAAIEVMRLCGGILAGIIIQKLETGSKSGGPKQERVIAWLCEQGFAWRPHNATTEARLTPKGRAKAQSILIHVSAGNF